MWSSSSGGRSVSDDMLFYVDMSIILFGQSFIPSE
jgi:hypothetical protein